MKKKIFYCFYIYYFCSTSFAIAGGFSSFFHLSRYEKWWTLTHPFIAQKAYRITNEARLETQKILGDSLFDRDPFGGQVDAFRHTYWMARLAQEISWKKALRLGKAHEKANYLSFKKHQFDEEGLLPDSASGAMDLFNNNVGVSIGCNFRNYSKELLVKEISNAIKLGKLIIIRKDSRGRCLNCLGELIGDPKYLKQWNIPKCLVKSNFGK